MPNYLNPKVAMREREDAAGLTDPSMMPAPGSGASSMPVQQFTAPRVESPEAKAAKRAKLLELLRMRGG